MTKLSITKIVQGEGEPTFPNPAVGVIGTHKESGDQQLRSIFPAEDMDTAQWIAGSLRKSRDVLAGQEPTSEESAELRARNWATRQLFLAGEVELVSVDQDDRTYQANYSEITHSEQQAA